MTTVNGAASASAMQQLAQAQQATAAQNKQAEQPKAAAPESGPKPVDRPLAKEGPGQLVNTSA